MNLDDLRADLDRLKTAIDLKLQPPVVPVVADTPVSVGVNGLMPMGMNVHYWSQDTIDQGVSRLGMTFARIACYFWNGAQFLSWTDPANAPLQTALHFVDRCKALGITPFVVLVQQPGDGLAKFGSAAFPTWLQWVTEGAQVLTAKGVKHFEILNEPGVGAGPAFTGQEYGQLFVATAAAIKSVAPTAICVGPATTATFRNGGWLQQMFAVSGVAAAMDVFSIHNYYLVPPEDSFTQDMLYCAGLIEHLAGRKIPGIQSECGYTDGTGVPSSAEKDNFGTLTSNADRYSRKIFLHRASGYLASALYKARRNSSDTVDGENNFGALNVDWSDRRQITSVIRDAFAQVNAASAAAAYQRGGSWFVRLDTPTGQKLVIWNAAGATEKVYCTGDAVVVRTVGTTTSATKAVVGTRQMSFPIGPRAQVLSGVSFPEFT